MTQTTPDHSKPDWEGFGKAVMEEWADHWDLDAPDKFRLAVHFNLLREVPGGFDPETHTDEHGCLDPGDPFYMENY